MRKRRAFADKELEEAMLKREKEAEVLELQLAIQLHQAAAVASSHQQLPQQTAAGMQGLLGIAAGCDSSLVAAATSSFSVPGVLIN